MCLLQAQLKLPHRSSLYHPCTKFEDEKNVESWNKSAEGILVFTGLFSSTVATFIALSYPTLQQDPNVTTQLLLAQILHYNNYRTLPQVTYIKWLESMRRVWGRDRTAGYHWPRIAFPVLLHAVACGIE
ncbi:hypothetical protein EDB92DRAFT_188310 [Lactarius akahatsu]|uniref:DUF6535 domain-containing protein n=1 Tax=Lactarius akahatsu TaxID=416441 RepID=A0AAD4L5W8_9AGAM|nr:hypothetical protein EDB92DRAFT_188310 [Lactarius akahatsu]